jgi:hypothetical protein
MRAARPHGAHSSHFNGANAVTPIDHLKWDHSTTEREVVMTRTSSNRAKSRAATGYQKQLQKSRRLRRTARRFASRTAVVAAWWDALQPPKPDFFTTWSLSIALGAPTNRFAAALRRLGWHRTERRVHGTKTTLWLPPNSSIKTRPVGRPRANASDSHPSHER